MLQHMQASTTDLLYTSAYICRLAHSTERHLRSGAWNKYTDTWLIWHRHRNISLCFCVVQDEFRRWFLAKVRVMLAPGRNPFHCLETQTTSSPSSPTSSSPPVANGHTPHLSDSSPAQELIRRYADYQPTQVPLLWETHTHTHTQFSPSVSLSDLFDNAAFLPPPPSPQIRYFTLHSTKYYWNEEVQNFEVLT